MKVNQTALERALAGLVARLRVAGYGPDLLRQRLGITFPDDVGLLNRAPALERLRGDRSPEAAAIRLWFLEAEQPAAGLRGVFPPTLQTALAEARLVATRAGRMSARLRLDVHRTHYLLADRRFRGQDAGALGLPRGDAVYPPGSDSVLVADVVPVRDGERVLDLCTGSGIQALAVASRAGSVVAVDIGARAAAMAQVNARMNGISNLVVRQGDLFGPVRGERFDLITANPPFVPAPQRGPAYHSGGPRGDRVLRRVIAGLGAHLEPGGRAAVISHLGLRRGETVAAAVAPWRRGFDGRLLVLQLEAGTPVDLAAAQALFALDGGFAAYGREVRHWVGYLDRHRIERIVLLVIVAERTGRAEMEVVEAFQRTLPLPLSQPPATLVANWLQGSGSS